MGLQSSSTDMVWMGTLLKSQKLHTEHQRGKKNLDIHNCTSSHFKMDLIHLIPRTITTNFGRDNLHTIVAIENTHRSEIGNTNVATRTQNG